KGGDLVQYRGKWYAPEEAVKRKKADEDETRHRAELAHMAEVARKRKALVVEAARMKEKEKRNDFDRLMAAGLSALKNGDKEVAVLNYRNALNLYPGDQDGQTMLKRALNFHCEEVVVKEGYFKINREQGHLEGKLAKIYIPGKITKVWVEPVYEKKCTY
ncbi:hypothetical protein C2E25_16635, partial [Geothermobacter hydrogeniphilus]